MEWSTACPDWETRIKRERSLIPFEPLFKKEAEESLNIYKSLHIVDMPGSPLVRDVTKPWVFDFVSHIFGSYDAEKGRRLIQEYFLLISKKNTKSTTAAHIMLTALIRNWRPSAEFLILAPTLEVANNSFHPIRDSIKADPELDALLHIQPHMRMITHRLTNATLKVVAADNDTVSGKKASGILIDELWLFGKKHNAENMLREATGGLASRPEGFVIYLTTQSDEPPAGIYKQKLDYARQVRDGEVEDNQFLPVLYEFPKSMEDKQEYLNPENFYITNPNLGASVDEIFLKRQLKMAVTAGGDSLNGFLAKHLNVEIGMNLRADRWPGADFWNDCGKDGLTLDEIYERSEVIAVGIDGGGLDDLLGLAVIGRDELTKKWLLWTKAWAHPSVLERRKEIAPALRDMAAAGEVSLVEHDGQDIRELMDILLDIHRTELLHQIGIDPYGMGGILDAIEASVINSDKVVGISQGWKLGGAIKTTERRLADKAIIHGNQLLMKWCVGNAKVEQRTNSILVTKGRSGLGKIDPLMATFNAVAILSLNPASVNKEYDFMVM